MTLTHNKQPSAGANWLRLEPKPRSGVDHSGAGSAFVRMSAMSADRPIQLPFKDRVMAAIEGLEGYPGAPVSLTQLAGDCGMSLPNLTSALSLRRTMTWAQLKRIHQALKLDALGIDLSTWDTCSEEPDRLRQEIRSRRDGDPVELLKPFIVPNSFLGLQHAGGFMGLRPGVRKKEDVERPGIVVLPGQTLEMTVELPIDGFLKVVCREGGEFFSLDEHFGLTRRRFKRHETVRIDQVIDVEPSYFGETVFIGLASTDPFDANWPRGHGAQDTVSRETCADLMRAFLARPDQTRQACVYSIWTVPELPAGAP